MSFSQSSGLEQRTNKKSQNSAASSVTTCLEEIVFNYNKQQEQITENKRVYHKFITCKADEIVSRSVPRKLILLITRRHETISGKMSAALYAFHSSFKHHEITSRPRSTSIKDAAYSFHFFFLFFFKGRKYGKLLENDCLASNEFRYCLVSDKASIVIPSFPKCINHAKDMFVVSIVIGAFGFYGPRKLNAKHRMRASAR